ncbi:hydroxyacylglutathione hydrolase [Thalassovita gelatinovora]|uniref:Hydroxyacylglutathione hydrolase n=1 Tax=Thalassovita gelatinovora TaxID=53501 RepID=A0A0P1F8G0_THAGE|nr:MBL fold metallo-hydrolase [Thalassovita gelatinovora]QIZ80386.1 MBL fold metallo-hydrolase [Thalassovita gelatinovora]CUH64358.1 hydroxyacylglutathione hydrolase [Thalassovita gelatinovora]SEQ92797.1 Glyoxylase, beta-lactamase superfamily II [Thalassovita gelatinovora]
MSLQFPFPALPAAGETLEVAPGILWARLSLPFRLNHVNIYFIEDDDGWAIVDTGISNPESRAEWQALIDGPMAGRKFTRLIVTHHHPDHIGNAGWLCEKLDIPMATSAGSFLSFLTLSNPSAKSDSDPYTQFYARHGMPSEGAKLVSTLGHGYLRMVSTPPDSYLRLHQGMDLRIGGRNFQVLTGDGHSLEQVMLYSPSDNLFLAADQVIERISPNISVFASEPAADPLGLYLTSLGQICDTVPEDVLVLSGHHRPFYGLHQRRAELAGHHAERCEVIAEACGATPQSVNDLVSVMFKGKLDAHEVSFAFSEALAHANYMAAKGDLNWIEEGHGLKLIRA